MNRGYAHRLGIFILSILLLSLTAFAASTDIKDVPVGHWAYDAVRTLVGRGYLTLGADGAFRGNEPVDRYTFASVLAEILDEFSSAPGRAESADAELLRKLTNEYRAELVQYYAAHDQIGSQVENAEKRMASVDEKINDALVAYEELGEVTADLQKQVDANAAQTYDLRREIDGINYTVDSLSQDLNQRLRQTETDRRALERRVSEQELGVDGRLDEMREDLDTEIGYIRDEAYRLFNRVNIDQDAKRDLQEKEFENRFTTMIQVEKQAREKQGQILEENMGKMKVDLEKRWDDKLQHVEGRMQGFVTGFEGELDEQYAALESLQEDLDGQKDKLNAESAARTVAVADLAKKLAALETGLSDTAVVQQRNLDGKTAALQEQLQAQKDELTERQSRELQALQAELSGTQRQLRAQEIELKNQIDDLQVDVDKRYEALEGRVVGQDEEFTRSLQVLKVELAEQKAGLETEGTVRKQTFDIVDEKIGRLQGQMDDALTKQDGRIQKQVEELYRELATQKKDLGADATDQAVALELLESEVNVLRSRLELRTKDLGTKIDSEVADLGEEMAALDRGVDERYRVLRQEFAADQQAQDAKFANDMQALREQLTTLNQDIDGRHKILRWDLEADREAQDIKFAGDVQALREQLAALEQDMNEGQKGLRGQFSADREAQDSKFASDVQALREQLAALEQDVDEGQKGLRWEFAADQQVQDERIASDVEALRAELAQHNDDLLRVLDDIVASQNKRVDGLMGQISALHKELARQEQARQSENQDLRNELALLAAQNQQLSDQFQLALAAMNTDFEGQMDGLRAELVATEGLLEASQLGLSPDQMELLDARILSVQNKLGDQLTSALARERNMTQRITKLEEQQELTQEQVEKDIKSTKGTAWGAAALSALLGIFIVP